MVSLSRSGKKPFTEWQVCGVIGENCQRPNIQLYKDCLYELRSGDDAEARIGWRDLVAWRYHFVIIANKYADQRLRGSGVGQDISLE